MSLTRRRVLLALVLIAILVVVLVGGLIAWQAVKVNSSLNRAVDDASTLRAALEDADAAAIDSALVDLQESSAEAEDHTGGAIWGMAGWLPVVGDDARGVETAAAAVASLASEDGIAPLVRVATEFDRFVPQGGSIDVQAIASLQQPVEQAAAALADARAELAGEDASGFVQRFKDQYRSLQDQVGDAASAMDAAAVATDILPAALGQDEERSYLLVFQNNAEIRATGGLPGAMATVNVDDGQLSLGRQASASSFGPRSSPVLPLSADEKDVFGNLLGLYAMDANFTPDWPRAAELLRARWEEDYPERFDGVITLDTVALSYLLDVTGPVQVGPYEISGDNAVDVLLNQVYVDIESPAAQDVFFQEVASTVFERFRDGQVGQPRALLSALRTGVEEGRIYVNLTDEDEQAQIADRRVSGSTTQDGVASRFDVTFLDATASKMSYYLRYDVRARVNSCAAGRGSYTITVTMRSQAPAEPPLPNYISGGSQFGQNAQLVQTRLFTPSGGKVTGVEINGTKVDQALKSLGDRAVSAGNVVLAPGEVGDVVWQVEVPDGSDSIPVQVTPGLEDEDESTVLAPACR